MKTVLKESAIKLRKKGYSYSEILTEVKVAKSTLSLWLRTVGLAEKQTQIISKKRIAGRLRALEVIRENKIRRVSTIKDLARSEVSTLITNPFWLIGVILYWAEGAKEHTYGCPVKFTNMNLQMHKFFIQWIEKFLCIKKEELSFDLFIHEKADIKKAKQYWMRNLGFSENKLKVYFKKHNPKTKRRNIGSEYNGVLQTHVYKSIALNRKIAGWIEGIVVYLNSTK